jgi:hypothetical protein
MLLQKKSAKSLGAAPTCKLSMARASANYVGPFSTNSLISMALLHWPWPKIMLMPSNYTNFKVQKLLRKKLVNSMFVCKFKFKVNYPFELNLSGNMVAQGQSYGYIVYSHAQIQVYSICVW